ncbi:MAG: pyridoxal-phosphate dependent enzyme, partial [Rickettsiales bacterium]|nr:pyridoxal-phosphate dependent enzyme [Rickettsiales bacterium]
MLNPGAIEVAYHRITPHVRRTPLLHSYLLNHWLGHQVYFKAESFQKTGAFKIRGALNTVLALKEQEALGDHVVAFSSGNHAQAVAYAAHAVGVKATVFMPEFVSRVKQAATRAYGATVVLTE